MNYSNLHKGVIDKLQRSKAGTEPQNFLGPNYQSVLDFWASLDTLTKQQWTQVIDLYNAIEDSTKVDGYISAWYAAQDVIGHTRNGNVISYAIQDATFSLLWGTRALSLIHKTNWELIGMPKLFEQGKSLFFVPLFDNL